MAKTTPAAIPRPDLQVIQRGLENVFGLPSASIELKEPGFVTHWANTAISGEQLGKYLDAGYLKVRPEYLKDPDRVAFTVSPEGYVVRGQRGEEVLVYTLDETYRQRQLEKARRNQERMRPQHTRAAVAEAAGKKLGDEAAEFLHRHGGPTGTVTDKIERMHRADEGE